MAYLNIMLTETYQIYECALQIQDISSNAGFYCIYRMGTSFEFCFSSQQKDN